MHNGLVVSSVIVSFESVYLSNRSFISIVILVATLSLKLLCGVLCVGKQLVGYSHMM